MIASFCAGRIVVKNVDNALAAVDGLLVAIPSLAVVAGIIVLLLLDVVVVEDGQVDDIGQSELLTEVPRVTARATGLTVVRAMRLKLEAVVATVRANFPGYGVDIRRFIDGSRGTSPR